MGQTEFCGRTFKVDRRALIPRPETEIVAETTLKLIEKISAPRLVDIGTGSGILAITAAAARDDATVVACDVSADALALARENAERHNVFQRIDFRLGDFADTLSHLAGSIDAVMANPPYVAETELPTLQDEVRDHEPRVALIGGPGGTEIVERLLDFVLTLLKPGGHLIMEIGLGQAAKIRKMIAGEAGMTLLRFEEDFNRIQRVAVVRRNDECPMTKN